MSEQSGRIGGRKSDFKGPLNKSLANTIVYAGGRQSLKNEKQVQSHLKKFENAKNSISAARQNGDPRVKSQTGNYLQELATNGKNDYKAMFNVPNTTIANG